MQDRRFLRRWRLGMLFSKRRRTKAFRETAPVLHGACRTDAIARTRPKLRKAARSLRAGYMPFLIPCQISQALTG